MRSRELPALRTGTTRLLTGGVLLTLVALAAWTLRHGVAGTAWSDVVALVRSVRPTQLGLLAGVWFGGLAVYATVLSSALPGLDVRRGLLLNLSGSAVANVVPLGGAVATGMNWRMARGWGFSARAFGAFCTLTNALDVATKLVLPIFALAVLSATSVHVPAALWLLGAGCALVLLAGTALRRLGWLGRVVAGVVADCGRLMVEHRARLLGGSAAYAAAQVALLWVALLAVGLHPSVGVVIMAAAIERLSCLVPITPGGAGVAEAGTVAWLLSCGVDPAGALAGVLLYRVFVVGMEIPVGAALLGGWWWRARSVAVA